MKTNPKKTMETCMMTKKNLCAKKMKTVKKNQTARSQIWKICQTSSVTMANGTNVKSNQSIWARSNVKPTSACFTVWKVSWLKVMPKPNVKRTKMEYGNSIKNLECVSNAAMTVQRWKCLIWKNQIMKTRRNLCAKKAKTAKKNQKNQCVTKVTKPMIVTMKKNRITMMRSQCAKKVKTAKKNRTARSLIWKKCQMSLVTMANGISVKSNPSIWVKSNAKPTNVCFTVWKASWLKATEKPNAKRTRVANGSSTRNSVPVSNAVMIAQKSRCQKCQKMKKNQKTKKRNLKTKKRNLKTKKRSQKTRKKQVKPRVFPEMTANGKNANLNQLKMVKSLAWMLSAVLNVKKASW